MTYTKRSMVLGIVGGLALLFSTFIPLFAEFTNGGFETGDFTGWSKSSYLSNGLTGLEPFSGASRTILAGGSTAESIVISSPAETGIDPQLTAAATLRFPKFGSYVARVNDTTANQHANTILQRSTMTINDLDPIDGKLHIRFAFAPVVKVENHSPAGRAYFYVAVRNVTKGNALLFESLHYANETGYPWKIAGAAYYTDWQLVDVAPGDADLALGDVFSMEVTASGCGPTGGHYGYAYVDSFNRDITGLAVQAVADKELVSGGDAIIYTFTYRNGGAVPADNVVVKENIPAMALFASVSDPVHCSTAAGIVTCNFGTLAPGESGTFQVGVTVRSTATVSVANSNYYVQASSYTPLLGPAVNIPVKGLPTDLTLRKTASPANVGLNGLLTYTLRVKNNGPAAASNIVVVDTLPAGVELSSTTTSQGVCTGVSKITCRLGTIASLATSTVTITVRAIQAGEISNTASVSGSFDDLAGVDNSSVTVIRCWIPPVAAPAGLTGTAQGVSSITWTWNSLSDATSYRFYPSTGGPAITVNGTSLTQTGLSANMPYSGQVSGWNFTGEGPLSASATAYTLALPPAGTQALVLSSAAIQVQWTDTGATAYEVERSTMPGSGFVIVGSSAAVGAALLFGDQGLDPTTTYYYQVRAYNFEGLPGNYAAVASTETYAGPPGAPVMAAFTVSSDTFRWYWTPSGGQADSFTLFSATGTLIAVISGTDNHYLETNVSTVTLCSRYLMASNHSGTAYSSTVTVATPYLQSFFTGTSTSPLVGADGQTGLIVPVALMGGSTTWLISEDPLQGPLMSNTTALINTSIYPAGMQSIPISLTEYLVAVNGNRFTGTFSPPVTVEIPYTDSVVPGIVDGTSPPVPVYTLQLFVLDETTGVWTLVPGSTVDTVKKVVTGTINHLSIFMAFGTGVASNLSGVRVYPNPYRPHGSADQGGGDTGINFSNLTKSVKIKIYTVTGREVASFGTDNSTGALRWDVRNASGERVASGGYIAVITSPGVPKIIKKIMVVR